MTKWHGRANEPACPFYLSLTIYTAEFSTEMKIFTLFERIVLYQLDGRIALWSNGPTESYTEEMAYNNQMNER